jgi:hypothetical protein
MEGDCEGGQGLTKGCGAKRRRIISEVRVVDQVLIFYHTVLVFLWKGINNCECHKIGSGIAQ